MHRQYKVQQSPESKQYVVCFRVWNTQHWIIDLWVDGTTQDSVEIIIVQ